MEPLTTLSTALAVTKNLRDLAKTNKPDMGKIRETLIELQGAVLDAREREAALADDNRRLRADLVRLRDWKKELSEYRLENVAPGAMAYVHQSSKNDPKTAHWLCQACADSGEKSILQIVPPTEPFGMFVCPRCKNCVKAKENRPGGLTEKEPSPI